MMRRCDRYDADVPGDGCGRHYNDVTRSTVCPHAPLEQYVGQLAEEPPVYPAPVRGWSPAARVVVERGQAVPASPSDDPALVRGLDTLPDL